MKRVIALLLVVVIVLTGCTVQTGQNQVSNTNEHIETEPTANNIGDATQSFSQDTSVLDVTNQNQNSAFPSADNIQIQSEADINLKQDEIVFAEDVQPEFAALSEPALLQYVEDNIYADLVSRFDSENYIIEDVSAVYVSQEYLEEVAYNSQSNVYFGYTLEELDTQFQGTRYVFSLGENGETVIEKFEAFDDTYNRAIKNVAVGTGVILVCVTVSVVSGGASVPPAVSMIFTSAAKTGTMYALSAGTISAVAAGTITGIQTGDFEEAKKAAAMTGSESFKWGAITGVITGGVSESVKLYRSAKTISTPRESELTVLDRTPNSTEQISYLDGVEVPMNTPGATRPDVVVKNADGTIKAIEVKNYNLAQSSNRNILLKELERQVGDRVRNLPTGSTQEIVLDVRGRGFSEELIKSTVTAIQNRLINIYTNIPITILRY